MFLRLRGASLANLYRPRLNTQSNVTVLLERSRNYQEMMQIVAGFQQLDIFMLHFYRNATAH